MTRDRRPSPTELAELPLEPTAAEVAFARASVPAPVPGEEATVPGISQRAMRRRSRSEQAIQNRAWAELAEILALVEDDLRGHERWDTVLAVLSAETISACCDTIRASHIRALQQGRHEIAVAHARASTELDEERTRRIELERTAMRQELEIGALQRRIAAQSATLEELRRGGRS
jgi:hypothetical protein